MYIHKNRFKKSATFIDDEGLVFVWDRNSKSDRTNESLTSFDETIRRQARASNLSLESSFSRHSKHHIDKLSFLARIKHGLDFSAFSANQGYSPNSGRLQNEFSHSNWNKSNAPKFKKAKHLWKRIMHNVTEYREQKASRSLLSGTYTSDFSYKSLSSSTEGSLYFDVDKTNNADEDDGDTLDFDDAN